MQSLQHELFPLIHQRYGLSSHLVLSVADLFFVKYSAQKNAQRDLSVHVDGFPLSFNILLNHESEFKGLRTYTQLVFSLLRLCFWKRRTIDVNLYFVSWDSGGGTYFEENQEVVENMLGSVVCHSGLARHGGHAITQGERYILVGFLQVHRRVTNELCN